ncbi:MAG: hypothetical protein KBC33_00800 [Candidatus Pacebacteria bacterium]|nr:hypothetical protein [Candidatus Paceibacterota bacterium]
MEISELFFSLKPYIVAVHAASAIAGMGAALTSDIMFSFYSRDRIFDEREQRVFENLSRIIWISLIAIIITGAALFLSDPVVYSASTKFLVKMTIVLALTLNGIVLSRWIQPHIAQEGFLTSSTQRHARRIAFACGAISLTSWSLAFILGMIDSIPLSYTGAIISYLGLIGIAAFCAILIEHHSFE